MPKSPVGRASGAKRKPKTTGAGGHIGLESHITSMPTKTFESDRHWHNSKSVKNFEQRFRLWSVYTPVESHTKSVCKIILIRSIKMIFVCANLFTHCLILDVVVGSTTHLFRWKEEKISFASLLAQSEELTQVPIN